ALRWIPTSELGGARRGSAFGASEPRRVRPRVAELSRVARACHSRAYANAQVRAVLGRVRLPPDRSLSGHWLGTAGRSAAEKGRTAGGARGGIPADSRDHRPAEC